MRQDKHHLDLLSTLYYVLGGLTALFSCLPMIHLGMGIAMLAGAFDTDQEPVPEAVGWLFVIMGAGLIACGWAMAICLVLAGRNLGRRRGRTFCIVIAAIACLMVPLGTALGVFTLIVLMKDEVIELFAAHDASPAAP